MSLFSLLLSPFACSLLREYFQAEFTNVSVPFETDNKVNVERVVDDFVLFCMLVGNDFLPGTCTLHVRALRCYQLAMSLECPQYSPWAHHSCVDCRVTKCAWGVRALIPPLQRTIRCTAVHTTIYLCHPSRTVVLSSLPPHVCWRVHVCVCLCVQPCPHSTSLRAHSTLSSVCTGSCYPLWEGT